MGTIKRVANTVVVSILPEEIITKPAYNSDGKRVWKTGLTIGQIIGYLAKSYVIMKAPGMMRNFISSEIRYEDGKFIITLE